jgi:glycosyltransferase involved in cell wall biosynthesis
MCKALQDAGCEVQICTTNADGKQGLPVGIGRMLDYEGIETIFFTSSADAFKYSRSLARWLDNHVAEFDLVHVHAVFNHSSYAAARAARKHGVPYIIRPLGTLDPWSMGQKSLKKKLFWRAFAQRMMDGAAAVHYTAAAEQQAVEGSLKVNHGVVIPLGVDPHFSSRIPHSDQPILTGDQSLNEYVLFLSRLQPEERSGGVD